MRDKRYLYLGTIGLSTAIGVALMSPLIEPAAAPPARLTAPLFQVDPFWPKPLPDNWVTGEIGGTCIDSQDHLFIVTRGFQTGGLVSPEGVAGRPEKSKASPPVIEFDPHGNVVRAWGDASIVPTGPNAGKNAVLPHGTHGCFVDYEDNVWIGGNSDGVVQKWSHDGSTLLLQIGTKFLCDSANGVCAGDSPSEGFSRTLLHRPADIAVDPNPDPKTGERGSVYVADGYGSHRVVVFDRRGNYLRQMGGVGTGPGQFAPGGGGHPHCVVIGNNGLVYACDRANERVNVYRRDGTFVRAIPVIPGTAALGTAGSAWDVDFSPDRQQTFMYESDGGNEVIWIFDHRAALLGSPNAILDGFGRPGHMAGEFTFLHMMAIDSKGNLYVGETIGGRRVQKFFNCGADRDDDQGRGKRRSPHGCRGNNDDDH
jgi:hypothetical protein